jgi:hypothetical protein
MTRTPKKRKKPKNRTKPVESQAEFVERLARIVEQRFHAFNRRLAMVREDVRQAVRDATAAGEGKDRIEARAAFVRDSGLLAAISELPKYPLTRAEFEAAPIISLDELPEEGTGSSEWQRCQVAGVWIIFNGAMLWRPDIDEPSGLN